MEVFVAILWYLHVLVPGVEYTEAEVNTAIDSNIIQIEEVQEDTDLMESIMSDYNGEITIDEADVAQPWEIEEEPKRSL